jgi:hypothetical protein
MEEEIRDEVKNTINRIENYILLLKSHFLKTNVNINLTFYSRIHEAFILHDGSKDEDAIFTMSNLCKKNSILLYLEMNCKIVFQASGIKREIGVNRDSNITIDHKKVLFNACFLKKKHQEIECLVNNNNETAIAITETDIKTPKFCSKKSFVKQTKRGQNKIVKNIKNCFNNNFQIKNENDIDNIAVQLMSKSLKRKYNEIINNETPTINQQINIVSSEEKEKLKKKNLLTAFKEVNNSNLAAGIKEVKDINAKYKGINKKKILNWKKSIHTEQKKRGKKFVLHLNKMSGVIWFYVNLST